MSLAKDLIILVQARLKDLGYYSGFLDGEDGPLTRLAIVRFKETNGFRAREYVGPLTHQRLFDPAAKKSPMKSPVRGEPPWLTEARALLGTDEVAGVGNNPVIMQWAEDMDQWYPGDDTPWCGLFVAHCMTKGAPEEPQTFNRLGARNWAEYGKEVEPSVGAIAVFWRTHPTKSWNGHVGFFVGADDTTYHVLGGNQSDSVTVTRISKHRLLAARGPTSWGGGSKLVPVIGPQVTVSTNEA